MPERAINQLGWRVRDEGPPCDRQTAYGLVAVGFQALRSGAARCVLSEGFLGVEELNRQTRWQSS